MSDILNYIDYGMTDLEAIAAFCVVILIVRMGAK